MKPGRTRAHGSWQLPTKRSAPSLVLSSMPHVWALLEALQPRSATSSCPKHSVFACQNAVLERQSRCEQGHVQPQGLQTKLARPFLVRSMK